MKKPIRVLTFDIEEWFNLLDINASRSLSAWDSFESRINTNTERILEHLESVGCRATFFCLGWIAEKYPEVIRKIDQAGFEIGSHTYSHQLAYEITSQEFREDLLRSNDLLGTITGKAVRCFRVPGFSVTEANRWVLDILAECGIMVDSSIFPAGRGHGGFPSFGHALPVVISTGSGNLREFPINTASIFGRHIIFSGGGYFRLLPYTILRHLTRQAPYVMTYFHPRDFDPGQPVLPGMPWHRRFKSYVGLSGALVKLKRLLSEFTFTDIANAEAQIDWEQVPVVKAGAS